MLHRRGGSSEKKALHFSPTTVMVTDPQKYAECGNFLIRKLNSANAKMSGSPIYISSNTLAIAFPELVSLFEKYLQKYGGDPIGQP